MAFVSIIKWFLGIKSPSKEFCTFSETYFVKPLKKGMKTSQKNFQKYEKTRKKFEQKWLKQNTTWEDTRQKKKALLKEFVKTFPQYKAYIQLERLGQTCKKS